ncbi:MAG: DUF1015 family protein, partial [Gemmatimonadaceae bacterium]
VELPALQQRLAILELHAKGQHLEDAAADLPYVARRTAGFTGADLANVVNEAALLAVRWRSPSVGRRHLEEAVERVVSGPRRAAHIIPPEEKRHIAVHEAGHAVAAAALGGERAAKLSLVARGHAGGLTWWAPDADGSAATRHAILARVRVEEYGPGRVRPHERTQPGPKQDRLDLTRATRFNLSPIFSLSSADAWPQVEA